MGKTFSPRDLYDLDAQPSHVRDAAKRDFRRALSASRAERRFAAYQRAFNGADSSDQSER